MGTTSEGKSRRLQVGNDQLTTTQGLTEGLVPYFDASASDPNRGIFSQHPMHDRLRNGFLDERLPDLRVPQAHQEAD
jgi:hypothetical protein